MPFGRVVFGVVAQPEKRRSCRCTGSVQLLRDVRSLLAPSWNASLTGYGSVSSDGEMCATKPSHYSIPVLRLEVRVPLNDPRKPTVPQLGCPTYSGNASAHLSCASQSVIRFHLASSEPHGIANETRKLDSSVAVCSCQWDSSATPTDLLLPIPEVS